MLNDWNHDEEITLYQLMMGGKVPEIILVLMFRFYFFSFTYRSFFFERLVRPIAAITLLFDTFCLLLRRQ